MTDFTTIEQSAADGKPVELFDLAMGTEHWYLTSAGYDITYLYHTYESAPCKCAELSQSSEGGSDDIELEIPRGHALAVMCVAGAPDMQVSLTIYHGHDPYYTKYYTGYLNNFKFSGNSIPTLIFGSASSDMPMKGGRRRAMKQCDLKLYGYRCGVNKTAHEITGTIDTIDGVTITATEFGAVATSTPAVYGDLTDLTGCIYDASSESVYAPAEYGFDNNISATRDHLGYTILYNTHSWISTNGTNQWLSCQWTSPQIVKKVRIYKKLFPGGVFYDTNPRYFRIQGSDNGSDWTDIDVLVWEGDCEYYGGEGGSDTELLNTGDTLTITVTLDNSEDYYYYRIYVFASWNAYSVSIAEIEFIEADSSQEIHQFGAGGSIVVGNAERTIISHNGNEITINRPFRSDVAVGDTFIAYRGCDHSQGMCIEVFNNIINYGGRQHMPVKNPYTGRNSLVK